MSPFDLRASPFYLLGVSPRDNRAVIADATETAISDGRLPETEAIRAQQVLMAPKPRLGAELAWPLGLAPNRARDLIDRTELGADNAIHLPLLAGANIAAYRCSEKLYPPHHDLLLRFYEQKNDEELLNVLNSERRASGFPEVTTELVDEALRDLMQRHTTALTSFISEQTRPGPTLLDILRQHSIDKSSVISFLDDVVDRFDEWAAASLRQAEQSITDALDRIKEDPGSLDQNLPAFSSAISEWSSVAAPRQYMLARRHLKDPRTEQLLTTVRGVCLQMHNELGNSKTPLAVTKAALPAFDGSAEHLELVRGDIKTLEELVSSHGAFKIVEPLLTLVTELSEKHRELCTSIKKRNFRSVGTGLAGNLYRLFDRARQELAEDFARAVPFRIILSLAIDLNNQSQAAEEALILIRALQCAPEVPSEVADALRENGRVAHQTVLQKQLTAAAQGQRLGRCAALAKELENSSHDGEDRAGWRKLRQQFEHRRNVQRWKWGGWAAVIGGIIIAASLSDHSSTSPSTYRPPTTPSPSYARPSDVFTASEIQWCVFELDRLSRIRALTGNTAPSAVADAWNARHADFEGALFH